MEFSAFEHARSLRPPHASLLSIIDFIASIWALLLLTAYLYLLFLLTHGANAQIANSPLTLSFVLLMDTCEHFFVESMRLSLCLAEELLAHTLRVHFHGGTQLRVNVPVQHLLRIILHLLVSPLLLDWCRSHQRFLLFLVGQELLHCFFFGISYRWLHLLLHFAHLSEVVAGDVFAHVDKALSGDIFELHCISAVSFAKDVLAVVAIEIILSVELTVALRDLTCFQHRVLLCVDMSARL